MAQGTGLKCDDNLVPLSLQSLSQQLDRSNKPSIKSSLAQEGDNQKIHEVSGRSQDILCNRMPLLGSPRLQGSLPTCYRQVQDEQAPCKYEMGVFSWQVDSSGPIPPFLPS